MPLDQSLYLLGSEFFWMIGRRQWSKALAKFHAIESRTAELLAEQGKEP